ncbi:nucleoside phosphorylase [Tenacibaculum finnmarkense genomovar finnmarkense]|uniref:nucleoside phosphorylase n=1 Tax=Tenacibaculum finnmarkense TaxID=2781243 RepID=UPI00187B6458|nr:nucleoside phosphorylase [Tenacibaculum finnmarkense]MBE7660609.1 phosphorylase [Tenacibaculum finnmarkense genomovar finnmarkense]MCD8418140.1 nucleoside phosphorylase [Tenacibaculum finnmarkense genomovar finnmarkense]MCG8186459.1 nucleoside phosphorylase [Tenacibaculum finnmarkense genomovar finnmarkense]MCG8202946.1 nucleoside phosphorylase [Tenacibaculum finnmarkense genomovar finnmarkense]MCG8210272.1 nucleoside phosphorylase [Tenacibaculum finnmarkense genomovar finnmarkense]
MNIQNSELILNPDGSIYHLNLKPEHIATDIIFVGDQNRVEKVTEHFDSIEFTTQKREFKTTTGTYKGKRLTVISTGIGPDNIDIVLNELDALVNIDLETRKIKEQHTALNITRIGTSGSLQKSIPVDSFLLSTHAIDLNGMLHSYQVTEISHPEMEDAFIKHTDWSAKKPSPLIVANSTFLEDKLTSAKIYKGITATAGGFYGPQGRVLRLALQDASLNNKIDSFEYQQNKITNLEMETSAIYGLSKLLGHNAASMNAIIANRANGTFSENPNKVVADLIIYTLNKLVS